MSDLDGKVYIITGGSKGLGFATAQRIVANGGCVALLARDKNALDKAVATLGDNQALGVVVDMASRDGVFAAFQTATAHFGRLDGVINNAGLARPNKIEHIPEDELQLQVQSNFVGLVYGCQAAIPLLRENGYGRIINLSSASVRHTNEMSHLAIYSATKAAVDVFTRELVDELKDDNIYVTLLSPGFATTEFGLGWDMQATAEALTAWQDKGEYFDGAMEPAIIGDAIVHCLNYPEGVSVDFMEVKPRKREKKPQV